MKMNTGLKALARTLVTSLLLVGFTLTAHAASFADKGTSAVDSGRGVETADSQAVALVRGYLQALMTGDVDTISDSLGGSLATQRAGLLSNPSYSASLRRAYANADYEIIGSERLNENQARVDAHLDLGDPQPLSVQFVVEQLDSGYRIVEEN